MNEQVLLKPRRERTALDALRDIMLDVHAADPTLSPSRVRQIAFQMANDGGEIRVPNRRQRRHGKAR